MSKDRESWRQQNRPLLRKTETWLQKGLDSHSPGAVEFPPLACRHRNPSFIAVKRVSGPLILYQLTSKIMYALRRQVVVTHPEVP